MPNAGQDAPLASVRYTENFGRNLESIEAFWTENGFVNGYDRLLDELSDVVVPNLQRHPGLGRRFADRTVDSVEAQRLSERIRLRLSALAGVAQLREYVMDDYLVLYAYFRDSVDDQGVVQMLAIRHQKQFGFDLPANR